ncbi:N-(5'-phosphoribosyl)anthranilate isomerase [Pelistega indica]|uniref:N-(5'-phosphoribosyl)anthranilate isomerase n=1 Tax=Pelistega indica TaxID=1414851 RepID=V8G5L0_9BURK|nr:MULTISPECIES: phosphoribosylanthranilate isomerase [Pelistega]ETD71695.1 N-(5'-phosphoribosyl)anthranilate isomerase [Pelistega indica]
MRTRVKICGLRQPEEILMAAELGVDAIGFVIYPKSKRYVSLAQAIELKKHIPAFMNLIVLMVNPSAHEVEEVINHLQPDAIQFHGDETAEFCQQFDFPYWRAVRVGSPELDTTEKLFTYLKQFTSAQAFLFDTYTPHYGGSGVGFDLSILEPLKEYLSPYKMVIAGGIKKDNVDLYKGNYYAIDLSSGVEQSPGVKSLAMMREFMEKMY